MSHQTVYNLDRLESAWQIALAFNDTKELADQVNKARKATGAAPALTGDDLVAQIGGGC